MTPAEFAEKALNELNEEFKDDASYVEALEEVLDRAQTMLDAKKEEMPLEN